MRNTETELFENLIETLGKNFFFFQKDLFGAGRRGLFEGSRKIFKQSPSPHSKRDHRQIMK